MVNRQDVPLRQPRVQAALGRPPVPVPWSKVYESVLFAVTEGRDGCMKEENARVSEWVDADGEHRCFACVGGSFHEEYVGVLSFIVIRLVIRFYPKRGESS